MRVQREESGRELMLATPSLACGDEAHIHTVLDHPTLVAKIYHRTTFEQADKLAAMLSATPFDPAAGGQHTAIAWPVERLRATTGSRDIIGYLMPYVQQAYPLAVLAHPRERRRVCPYFHYGYLLRTARNLAEVVRAVHQAGHVVGDWSDHHVLVTNQALVSLVSTDTFQVRYLDQVYPGCARQRAYLPPELHEMTPTPGDFRPEHDAFALAVFVFQLLMQGVHPFATTGPGDGLVRISLAHALADGGWAHGWRYTGSLLPDPSAPAWSILPPGVQELLWSCFEDGLRDPHRRPDPSTWRQVLAEAEQQLTSCPRNEQHQYVRGLDSCPWCDLIQQGIEDPFPAREQRTSLPDIPVAGLAGCTASQLMPATSAIVPATIVSVCSVSPSPSLLATRHSPFATILGGLGAAVERRPWMVWTGVGAAGAMIGLVLTLWGRLPTSSSHKLPREEPSKSAEIDSLSPNDFSAALLEQLLQEEPKPDLKTPDQQPSPAVPPELAPLLPPLPLPPQPAVPPELAPLLPPLPLPPQKDRVAAQQALRQAEDDYDRAVRELDAAKRYYHQAQLQYRARMITHQVLLHRQQMLREKQAALRDKQRLLKMAERQAAQ